MNYISLLQQTYKGKKVLLTGHTGFKGSWMLAWLHKLGCMVKGFALAPQHENDLYCLIEGDRLCDSVIADIRDRELLITTILDFSPDFIFHFAAQPLVRRSYAMPVYTFDVNVTGTLNVLEAIRSLNSKCIAIIVTTDKVYENNETGQAYKVDDKLGGHDPYSASKAAAEILVSSYRNSFFDPAAFSNHQKSIASARAGNVIGGGDRSEDRIIPDIIRGLENNQTIQVRNPNAVRPWQFVLEPLGGYLLLGAMLEKDPQQYAGAWNFGPYVDDVLTVRQVVDQALRIFGSGDYNTPSQVGQPHEAGLLNLDIEQTVLRLGWKPKLNSSEAIEKTIQWYKAVPRGNALSYTLEQLDQYTGL
ncbi:MAG TPA: CDP-glucose 4,6-dehydratase [Chitinophagaceae bacterium]|nr:CDP-glucose 4,6-dehydratase [Chitinophagaceae bacterium]